MTIAQTARALELHPQTVSKWVRITQYRPRRSAPRKSLLDPYKALIMGWLDAHPLSAQQVFQRLRESGFTGGHTIVCDYVHKIRPRTPRAFLRLSFAPAECAQVDWGEYGSIAVGSTRRRLSVFVMVLCESRLMYVEFPLSPAIGAFLPRH